jgi:hypothetical protein
MLISVFVGGRSERANTLSMHYATRDHEKEHNPETDFEHGLHTLSLSKFGREFQNPLNVFQYRRIPFVRGR